MASTMFLGLMFLLTPMLFLTSSSITEFDVGGKDGWILRPSDFYNRWAQTNRFQVNDTLHFKYNKGNDSVLVVKKEDYDFCNINNPKQKLDSGDSIFKLSDSGLYFLISGNVDNCKHGQKLIVLVMAIKHHLHDVATPPSQPPTQALSPPQVHSSAMDTPSPSPSKASVLTGSFGVSVGFGIVVWVVLMMF